jgi:hypothetical protein
MGYSAPQLEPDVLRAAFGQMPARGRQMLDILCPCQLNVLVCVLI